MWHLAAGFPGVRGHRFAPGELFVARRLPCPCGCVEGTGQEPRGLPQGAGTCQTQMGPPWGFVSRTVALFLCRDLSFQSVCRNPNKARASSDANLFRERVVLIWANAVLTLGFAAVTRPGPGPPQPLGKRHLPQVFLGSSFQRRDLCGSEGPVPTWTTGSAVSTRTARPLGADGGCSVSFPEGDSFVAPFVFL